jgi:hypothetical protein
MDATAATLEAVGEDALASQLDRLTHNEDMTSLGNRKRRGAITSLSPPETTALDETQHCTVRRPLLARGKAP